MTTRASRICPLRRATALGLLVAVGCGGRIATDELPRDPIAFIRQEPKQGIAKFDEFMASIQLSVPGEAIEQDQSYATGRTTLALLSPSTREIRPIPDSGLGALPLDWSTDGTHLLIGRRIQVGNDWVHLFSWNRLTGAMDRVTTLPVYGPAAYGDGPIRLAEVLPMVRSDPTTPRGVYLRLDGADTRPLREKLEGEQPDVAPDGRTVVFVAPSKRRNRDPVILLGAIDSEEAPRPIARGRSPRFSRDGRWIAFVSRRRGNADVWMMRADGGSKRVVVASPDDDEFPAPSRDGRFVAYSSARSGRERQSHIYVARVADRVEIQLTQNGQNGRPVW